MVEVWVGCLWEDPIKTTTIIIDEDFYEFKMIAAKKILTIVVFVIFIGVGCKNENHIDKYNVSLDSLETLPDNFYAYRRGRVYLEDINKGNYRIWFNRDKDGNVHDIFKIEDFRSGDSSMEGIIRNYSIDTFLNKALAQKFIRISRLYKLGHLSIKRKNKISFSYKDGLAEQYVKAMNDSVNNIYANKKDFTLLENGWFEYVEK